MPEPRPGRPRDPMARRAQRRRERNAEPAEPTDAGTAAEAVSPVRTSRRGERRHAVLRAFLRPSRHQLVLAVVLGLVAMGTVIQLRSRDADDTYATARRADLIQLLDGLSAETRRLEDELATLEQTRRELESGADSQRVAREQAVQRRDDLAVLAGTVAAEGPGIRLRITAGEGRVTGQVLLNAVQELRDAGAEVIEIDDSIRVGTASWFAQGQDGLLVDGRPVGNPIVIEAIGDPRSLEEAVRFRGGLVSEITGPQVEGQVSVDQLDEIEVDSVRPPSAYRYAEPDPAPR